MRLSVFPLIAAFLMYVVLFPECSSLKTQMLPDDIDECTFVQTHVCSIMFHSHVLPGLYTILLYTT
jgi:hypothetical protein